MQILGTLTKSTCTPLQRLILGAQSRSQLIVLEQLWLRSWGAALARCGGDGSYESAWARAFQSSCQLPSLGRLAPPGPVKLPSRTPSGARALVSGQQRLAPRPLIPSCPLSQELVPLHRRGFGECAKARGGPNRHWELSWRLLGQTRWTS